MRKKIVKRRVFGTKERPRLTVKKSLKNIHAQVIDDEEGKTLLSVSTVDKKLKKKFKSGGNVEAAKAIGEEVGKKAIASGLKKVVFDRKGSLYHGRVKALADAARKSGLQF